MTYAKAFFALQLDFARRAGAFTDEPWTMSIRRFTNLPALVGIGGPDRDRLWDDLVADNAVPGEDAPELLDALHARYVAYDSEHPTDTRRAHFGCFALEYPWRGTRKGRLHFRNAEPAGVRCLGEERRAERRDELASLVAHAQRECDGIEIVRGGSWLYNTEAYRRLFPQVYIASARIVPHEPNYLSTWGQFVARDGALREASAAGFRRRIHAAKSIAECVAAFPLPKLQLECPFEAFVEHYLA